MFVFDEDVPSINSSTKGAAILGEEKGGGGYTGACA